MRGEGAEDALRPAMAVTKSRFPGHDLRPGSRCFVSSVHPHVPWLCVGARQEIASPTTRLTSEPRARRVPGSTPLRMASVSSETGPG